MIKKSFFIFFLTTQIFIANAAKEPSQEDLCKTAYILLQYKDINILFNKIGPDKSIFITHINEEKWNIAHFAAKNNHLEIITELSKFPIIINAQTADGKTPLMIAIEHSNLLIAHYLLQLNQINLFAEDSAGQTVIDYVIAQGHNSLIGTLCQAIYRSDEIKEKYNSNKSHLLENCQATFFIEKQH